LKEADFGVWNGECALGGEKCDKIVTDEKKGMGRDGIAVSCVGAGVF
jgi:hypothetical protein